MKNKNILKWAIPALCVIGLTSCLKNKNEQPDFSAATPIVEIPVASPVGDGSVNSLTASVEIKADLSDYIFYVNYAAPAANDRDIRVTFTLDTTQLDVYNTAQDAELVPIPSDFYSMPMTVTIPAGQRKVAIPMKISSTKLLTHPDTQYALGLKITDASGVVISKNFGAIVLKIGVKNSYDGVYAIKGYVFREGDATRTGYYKGKTTDFVTTGLRSNSFSIFFADGGGVGGVAPLIATLDPVTNKVTMSSGAASTLKNTPGYDNRYDPATRTYYLSYMWGLAGSTRNTTDTLTYSAARK